MDNQRKYRGRGGKKLGRGGFQQQQDRDQCRSSEPPVQFGHAGRGTTPHHQYTPRASSSSGSTFHDPGSGDRSIPYQHQRPFVPIQPDSRFRAPPPLHHGGPPIRWGPPGGQRPSRPAFSLQRTPLGPSEPSESSSIREQSAASAWGSKSASTEVPARDPQPGGAWPRKLDPEQSVAKAGTSKSTSSEVHRDSKPEVAQHQAPEKSSEAEASSSSKSGKKKKRKGGGICDKPLEESLKTDLVLGSSSPSGKKTVTNVEKTAPPAKPVKELVQTTAPLFNIPTRNVTPVHPSKYFQNEKGNLMETNLLRINIKNIKLKIYQYDVSFEPEKRRELFREALRLLFELNGINRHPAHDGRKQIFVAGSMIKFPGGTDSFTGHVEVSYEEGRKIEYTITVKLAREVDLLSLFEYMRNGSSLRPFDVQPLEIALMHPAMSNVNLIKAGRSFFTRPNNPIYLGNGMDLWKGHTQSVLIPWLDESKGTPHLYLNVDVAHKGFPRAQPVIYYIQNKFFSGDRAPPLRNDSRLAPWQKDAAQTFLKNIKVSYDDRGRKRTFKVDSLGPSAREARFTPENGREITVETYFRNEKRVVLKYPNLPCIDSRKRLFPMELCSVIPNQVVNKVMDSDQTSIMVKSAAKPTFERKQTINQSLRNIQFNRDPCMEEFGLTVSTDFEKVNSYELIPPYIQYANKSSPVSHGQWRQTDNFIRPINLQRWVLINTDDRVKDITVNKVIEELQKAGPMFGVQVGNPQRIIDLFRFRNENDFAQHFEEWKKKGAQFFLVILKHKDSNIYSFVKIAAELQVGVLTQCVQASTTRQTENGRFGMTAQNILLKLNAKINGVNHSLADHLKPEILNDDVMIVGADVTHPPPDSKDLSIAAVAASHDKYGFQYNMEYRLQAPRNEMIRDLKNIMEAQISFYKKNTGKLPKRILYYRDGVADSQFEKVLSYEVQAIRQAFAKLETRPTLTFIVVQKRHHVRFFPNKEMSDKSRNENVRPGTVVDEKITHPTEMNFYLVSHKSIQGTARPTKYHLLYDDSSPAIDLILLERLTYYLCHMYARCNRSVSYPAPTYYAHWGAFRAKAWWSNIFKDFRQKGEDPARLINEQNQRGRVLDDVVNSTPMFFI